MDMNDIQIIAEKILTLRNSRIELYPAERPMLKAPTTPCILVDTVQCSMSRTTIDVGRCSQCSPSNVQQEVDDPKKKMSAITRKKRVVTEMLPKNLIIHTPEQVSLDKRQFRRPALPTLCLRRGLGWRYSGATQQKNDGAGCVVSPTRSGAAEGKCSFL
jgi:hypothetical protein